MKYFKIALLSYLIIHITLILLVNFLGLTKMKNSQEEFNPIGNSIIQNIETPNFVKKYHSSIGLYVNLIGADRGYEFFSPNIASQNIEISFETEAGKELNFFKSLESKIKYTTFCLYLNNNIQDEEKRHAIMKSVSRRFFNKEADFNEVHIYAEVDLYESLESASPDCYMEKIEKVLLTKITKPNHETTTL